MYVYIYIRWQTLLKKRGGGMNMCSPPKKKKHTRTQTNKQHAIQYLGYSLTVPPNMFLFVLLALPLVINVITGFGDWGHNTSDTKHAQG